MEDVVYEYMRFPTRYFRADGKQDALGLAVPGKRLVCRYCVIDLNDFALDQQDEAIGVTWGSEALLEHCLVRGAGKLFLCGSGDKKHRIDEAGRLITLKDCILEDFGRRGPEVQCSMRCEMTRCLVRSWGRSSRFSVRAFGAWAHDGGAISAEDCLFVNECDLTCRQRIADRWHHFWQAIRDNVIKAIIDPMTYVAGWRRGLTASDNGVVRAVHCYASDDVIIQNGDFYMDRQEAQRLYASMLKLREQLLEIK